MTMPRFLAALQLGLYFFPLVSSYTWSFTTTPQQCATLSLQISGSGSPPYSVLIIPYGPTPLPNNTEVRTIVYQQFDGDSTSTSFQLKFPSTSQFVAVVSDSTGFGSGGTSVAASVMSSTDSSCFNPNQTVMPDFPFNIYPTNQVVQCNASRLWWDPTQVQGTPSFQGVIPGGQSFSIPEGQITQVSNEGTGFSWIPSVREGSTLIVVAGDDRGLGTGGSGLYTVAQGIYPNSSCLTTTSPSSTLGSPAGGTYPTNASGAETTGGTSSSSKTNVGAIVGGVIGGLAAIVILALAGFYFIRRRTAATAAKERPVDLLQEDPEDDHDPAPAELGNYYRPEPFLATEPTEVSSTYAREDGRAGTVMSGSRYGTPDRRQSGLTSFSDLRSLTPDYEMGIAGGTTIPSSSRRKSPMPMQLRPVNIIQHDDAGVADEQAEGEPETVELPPAYTNIRKTS
ncbi:uncharacterized protein EDB91DRAFT_535270 [Suillus paluster]|uniref:uncharacterized protein n=1 Tax=Suillus paluster TaxID=48578 RepID=UPI001B872101|nr:uncharacterized protein EDB91DRAFT_535270 [Suillus paluster]KAG1736085.1 hypothetical protein EDB91DRAFT_535270 [Suillus paluster]